MVVGQCLGVEKLLDSAERGTGKACRAHLSGRWVPRYLGTQHTAVQRWFGAPISRRNRGHETEIRPLPCPSRQQHVRPASSLNGVGEAEAESKHTSLPCVLCAGHAQARPGIPCRIKRRNRFLVESTVATGQQQHHACTHSHMHTHRTIRAQHACPPPGCLRARVSSGTGRTLSEPI